MNTGSDSGAHAPEHERMLVDVACGDLDGRAAAVRALRASCPRCAEELDALAALQSALDRDAAEEQAALAFGRAPLRALRASGAASAPRSTPSAWRRLAPLAAAAGLLALGVVGWRLWDRAQPAGTQGETPLGAEIRAVSPLDGGDSFERYEWLGELEPGDHFELSIHAAGAAPGTPPLFGPVRVGANSYTLRGVELPDAIRWDIERFDGSGMSQGSASTTVRRSPR
ncbi:MAG: hypothetical protein EPO68_09030 [Planctomycetota bacterium]|nr:MAG: hypothetical protein EPO68_09030 [Planctomycetota bacterium]